MDFVSSGFLSSRPAEGYSCPNWVIDVDPGLSEYYRKQVKFYTQRQRYAPHISVVRNDTYDLSLIPNKYTTGYEFQFSYSHHIYWNDTYVWLAAKCQDAEDFRESLGLYPFSPLTQSPTLEHKFHITIGNRKWKS